MAQVNTQSELPVGSGILLPAMANKFRVKLYDSKILMMQVTKVLTNMVDRTITVHVEQPLSLAQEVLEEVARLCGRTGFSEFPQRFPFSLELLDGNENVHSKVTGFAHVVKHEFILDYAAGKPAEHVLVLRYAANSQ